MSDSDLFAVAIDFDQSHLFFPTIIHWLILILLVLIVVFEGLPYWRDVKAGRRQLPFVGQSFDALRFFGTLILTVIYFISMQAVGSQFPNTGLGFLIMSIPYMALLSLLYLHDRRGKVLMVVGINALVAPLVAWFVLAQLFAITLP